MVVKKQKRRPSSSRLRHLVYIIAFFAVLSAMLVAHFGYTNIYQRLELEYNKLKWSQIADQYPPNTTTSYGWCNGFQPNHTEEPINSELVEICAGAMYFTANPEDSFTYAETCINHSGCIITYESETGIPIRVEDRYNGIYYFELTQRRITITGE